MRKTISIAALIAVLMMICSMFCLSFAVNAADDADAPVVVTVDIDKGEQTVQTDADSSPEIVKVKKSSGGSHNIVRAVIVGLVIGVVGAAIFIFVNISGYKNNGQSEPYPFNSKAPLDLKLHDDVLINTEVTKRKLQNNNNSN